MKLSFVYFISMGTFTKIGKADNVVSRLFTHQCSSPIELHLMAQIPSETPLVLERALHKRFQEYSVGGEWFNIPANELRKVFGELWAE